MAGWCNGSTPGSLPGDSVRVRACNHIAEWTSQFKSPGSLPGERWGRANFRYQRSVGVSPFSKMPDSVNTDFVSFNYHFPPEELSLVTSRGVCGLRQTLYKKAK